MTAEWSLVSAPSNGHERLCRGPDRRLIVRVQYRFLGAERIFRRGCEKPGTQLSQCLASFQRLQSYVPSDVDEIVVAIRWTFRLYPIPGETDRLTFDNGEGDEEIEDYCENCAAVNALF